MSEFSSWGPQDDGRLFPTVCAKGVGVWSTKPGGSYRSMEGTSMACPTATGTLALLSERYTQLNGGEAMPAALLKAVVANTARDAGWPHCDYKYGYGIIDAEQAVEALEKRMYKVGIEVKQGEVQQVEISVPPGVKGIRVMAYWHDAVEEKVYTYGQPALTNNLDLFVTVGANNILPWVCNHQSGKVNLPASRAVDNLNNMEQVTVTDAEVGSAGKVVANVRGTSVPTGAQQCVLTWWYERKTPLRVLAPVGPSAFAPGDMALLQVEGLSEKGGIRDYNVEMSYDGGLHYTTLGKRKPRRGDGTDSYAFSIPPDVPLSQKALLRVVDGAGQVAFSEIPFSIAPIPTGLKVDVPDCAKGGWKLTWTPEGAAPFGYAVFLVDPPQGVLRTIADVASAVNEYIITEEDLQGHQGRYYFSVASKTSADSWGRTAVAVEANAATLIKLSAANPRFDSYFRRTPSPWFRLKAGRQAKPFYQENLASEVAGAHIFGYTNIGVPKGETFDERDYFSAANAPYMASISLCEVDLTAFSPTDRFYFHISAGMGDEEKLKGNEARFRVVDGSRVLADQKGVKEHSRDNLGITGEMWTRSSDYYYEIAGGVKHELRIEFAAKTPAVLAFDYMGIQPADKEGNVVISRLVGPMSRPNLGVEPMLLVVTNPTSVPVSNLRVKYLLNGKLAQRGVIPELKPFQTEELKSLLDFSTRDPLGETMEGMVELSCPSNPAIETIQRPFTIENMGDILCMPTSKLVMTPMGLVVAQAKKTVSIDRLVLFADDGGARQDYTFAQKTKIKILPPTPDMRVKVTFLNFSVVEGRGDKLTVFQQTIDGHLNVRGKMGVDLTKSFTGERSFISHAADGALPFAFKSAMEDRVAGGWLARLSLVPNENTLTMLACSCEKIASSLGKVPVRIHFRNNTNRVIPEAVVAVFVRGRVKFTQKLQDIQPGEHEMELSSGQLKLYANTPQEVKVYIQSEDDLQPQDNVATCRGILSPYCFTDKLVGAAAKPMLSTLAYGNSRIEFEEVKQYNIYVSQKLRLYQGDGTAKLLLTLAHPALAPMQVLLYADWEKTGAYSETDRVVVAIPEGAEEVVVPLQIKKKERSIPMRLIYAAKGTKITACIEEETEASVYDLKFDVRSGSHPQENDLAIKALALGESDILERNRDYPLGVTLMYDNGDKLAEPFKGKVNLSVKLDGSEVIRETVDCASRPIPSAQGELELVLKDKLNIGTAGVHEVELSFTADGDSNNWNNRRKVTVVVPPEGAFSLSMQSFVKQDEAVWIQRIAEGLKGQKAVTLEAWLKVDYPQLGRFLEAQGLLVNTCGITPEGLPNNNIALLIGGEMAVWTQDNTLRPGQWTHLAMVFEDITPKSCAVKIYLNGVEAPVGVNGMATPQFENMLMATQLDGNIKGVRLWAKARSAEQIVENMYTRLPRTKGCVAEFPCIAGYGANVLFNTQGTGNAKIVVTNSSSISQANDEGTWVNEKNLFGGCEFIGQSEVEKVDDNAYRVRFLYGTDLSEVHGKIYPAWPSGISVSYNGDPVEESTTFDFSGGTSSLPADRKIELQLSGEIFGQSSTQTVTIHAQVEESNECLLTALGLPKEKNSGLHEDVELDVKGQSVLLLIPSTSGSLQDIT